jgi:serine/arginine repetitive matrix protein 2
MEDESNDFLGEVIDFGDGKTYTVPPEDTESVTGTAFNKETRLGDDYDRSWPRSRRLSSDSETAQSSRFSQHHGLPPRQPLGDGRVLFNERSNRLEPARVPHPATGAFHQHAPPYAHPPPRPATRRNSALSSSDRPMMGHTREPPPHTRDPPPHTRDPPPHTVIGSPTDGKTQRLSDARSTHSPIERRSSFLHDDDRPRIGSAPPKSRIGDESVLGLRRETSRDSQLSAGDRQAWGQQASSHRASTELLHQTPLGSTGTPSVSNKPLAEPVSGSISDALSPLEKTNTSPTLLSPKDISATRIPETTGLPTVPAVLNEEREKFMKQAAERARRRKQEEEAAREEARERARKKAAELEALSKASLVTASPLVALTRQSSGAKSPAPKSPIPKSPLVAPSVLPPTSASTEALPKPKETPVPTSAAAAASSWRTKPKPEPNMASAVSKDAQNELSQTVPLFTGSAAADQESHVLPPPATIQLGGLGGMQPIEELGKADGPIEVLDFSDMSKLAGRRTSIASPSESHRRKRSVANDFLDEAPTKRSGPGQANTWNKDTR